MPFRFYAMGAGEHFAHPLVKVILWACVPYFRTRQTDFYALLLEQAQKALEGLAALGRFMDEPNPAKGVEVRGLKMQAGDLRGILLAALNSCRETPRERGDIVALSRAIEDMVDSAERSVAEMLLFEVATDVHLKKMAKTLREAGSDIVAALRSLRDDSRVCEEHVLRAKKSGANVEHFHREALVELFKEGNVVKILKTRELYRHLSNSAEKGDEAAGIIGDMLVKAA